MDEIRSVMALIRGVTSLFPCPRCIIPRDKQGDLSVKAPLRTTAEMVSILREARGENLGDRKAKLKAVGLRDVDVRLCFYYLLLLTTPERTYSGESRTRTPTPPYLSIAFTPSPVACFAITCGATFKNVLRCWVGKRPLRSMRCMYLYLHFIIAPHLQLVVVRTAYHAGET